MSTVAIAGISGYTGQRLLPLLSRDPSHVKLLLRPSSAKRAPWNDDPRTVGVDLLDERALEAALRGVDVIACLVGTTRAQFAPAKDGEHAVNYETVDIGIPRALANAGARAGAKRFALLTSYGIERGIGAYAKAKLEAEAAVKASGLSTVIVRPSFIAGPGRSSGKVIDALTSPVRIFAKGFSDDSRSIDADDLAKAIFKAIESDAWDGRVVTGRDLHAMAKT
jgi:uncharacterized protein YbjT (DUF2867 family)